MKRKRGQIRGRRITGRKRKRYRRRGFRRGFDRTGGYYGRYRGPGFEKKFHQIAIDDVAVAIGMNVQTDLLTIPEGVGEEQRIGRRITIKNIGWHYTIKLLTTSTPASTADHCRVMLVQDKQANGATAANTDVLDTSDVFSFNNLANSSRFRVLMDKNYSLSSQSGAWDGTNDQFGEYLIYDSFFKKVNIPIEYSNDLTTGVVSTIRSNNIIAIVGSQGGFVKFDSIIRFRHTDL